MGGRALSNVTRRSRPCTGVQVVDKNKVIFPEPAEEAGRNREGAAPTVQDHSKMTAKRRPWLVLVSLPCFLSSSLSLLFFFFPNSVLTPGRPPEALRHLISDLSPRLSFPKKVMSCQSPDPQNTLTDRLNQALAGGGSGYVLSLCPSTQYFITQPLAFAASNQEISTQGYPTGNGRATLVVAGPVADGKGHTTAVDGTCTNCDGVKLRNIQVCSYRLRCLCAETTEARSVGQRDEG